MTDARSPQEDATDIREVLADGVRWQATAAGEAVIRSAPADLATACRGGQPTSPVKANPLRAVFRFTATTQAGPVECYLKRYDESSVEGRLKRLARGPAARVEWDHACYARAAGVPVPEPLAWGLAADASFLLTASCRPAENLDAHLDRVGWSRPISRALARLLAAAHAAGILHRDLHAGNLLCRPSEAPAAEPRLWLLDLHKARIARRPRPAAAIRNLGMMIAGLRTWAGPQDRAELLRLYVSEHERLAGRPQAGPPSHGHGRETGNEMAGFIAAVEQAAAGHAARLLASRDRSILRTSRYYARISLPGGWRGHVFLRRRRVLPAEAGSAAAAMAFTPEQWAAALADPSRLIRADSDPSGEVVKQSDSSVVIRRPLPVGPAVIPVFVKHHPWRPRPAAVADLVRRSRAVRGFKLGHQLLLRGVPTPLPLACLERRVGPWLVESILITEAVADAVHLERFLMERLPQMAPGERARVRRGLARQLGGHMAAMRRAGWVQRDMKAPNILVRCRPDGTAQIFFVDLTGLRRTPWARLRPLVRLNEGLWHVTGLTLTDRMRLLRSYLGPGADVKAAWRAIHRATLARLKANRPCPAADNSGPMGA